MNSERVAKVTTRWLFLKVHLAILMRTRVRMMRLAIALEGYRQRHGVFPETLNAQGLRLDVAVCRDPIPTGCLSISLQTADTSCAPHLFGKEAKGRFWDFRHPI